MKITLKKIEHRGDTQIGIYFNYNEEVKEHLKKLQGVRWSATYKVFYLLYTLNNKKRVFEHLQQKNWYVDYSDLKESTYTKKNKTLKIKKTKKKRSISEANKHVIRNYVRYLQGLRLSESTVKTYFTFVADFIDFIKLKPLESLDNTDVRLFVEQIVSQKNYAISTHRQLISAIKHFAQFYPHCSINQLELKRPKKSSYLPSVLSKEEVIDLLRVTYNLKHRATIALLYSAGLRISELLHLKLADIDIDRRQIVVKNSKGRKDRYIVMAESFIPLLKNYFLSYHPTLYFIEGKQGNMYSASSIRAFLKRSCKRASIHKVVTPHTLRHSYATHLIENGVGLRYVQELLGHSKPETTMIYTHVAKKDLLKIRSPLDSALIEFYKADKKSSNVLLSGNLKG